MEGQRLTLHQSRLEMFFFPVFTWAAETVFPVLSTCFRDPSAVYWSFPGGEQQQSQSSYHLADCSFCGLSVHTPAEMSWLRFSNAQSSLHCTSCGCAPEHQIHGLFCKNSCCSVVAVGMADMLIAFVDQATALICSYRGTLANRFDIHFWSTGKTCYSDDLPGAD